MIEKSLKKLILWAILFQGMYKINSFLSVFNKSIALLVTISLLSISFAFNMDENVKKELDTLYKSTSICEYYNSITNFSYGIINKILESTKIVLVDKTSQSDKNKEENKKNTEQNKLYFVKTTNETKVSSSRNLQNSGFSFVSSLISTDNSFNLLLNKNIFKFCIFKLSCIVLLFCYFARDNIGENININNIIKRFRLV